jgi:hypothetical protein
LPVPVLLKRLAAPEWVFNFGIFLLVLDWGIAPVRITPETGLSQPT